MVAPRSHKRTISQTSVATLNQGSVDSKRQRQIESPRTTEDSETTSSSTSDTESSTISSLSEAGPVQDPESLLTEDDYTSSSSSSSSSSEDESGSSDEDGSRDDLISAQDLPITNLPQRKKPPIGPFHPGASTEVQSRLARFLPTIAEANQRLEIDRAQGQLGARSIENVDEDEAHIEMNLGLGVLQDTRTRENDETSESSVSSDDGQDFDMPGVDRLADEHGDAVYTSLMNSYAEGGRAPLLSLVKDGELKLDAAGPTVSLEEGSQTPMDLENDETVTYTTHDDKVLIQEVRDEEL